MSTTYTKIRSTLAEMTRQPSWSPTQLKAALVARDKNRSENHFHTRPKAARQKRPLSDEAFDRLFQLMTSLDLIRRDKSDDYVISDPVKNSLSDDARYKLLLSRRVTDLLDQNGANIASIREAALTINYPDVRDPETILEVLKRSGAAPKFNVSTFTQILFLLAGAEQRAQRHMRIFYEFI